MTTYTCQYCGHTSRYRTPPSMCPMCMGTMVQEEADTDAPPQ